ncbi:rho guanine nucleotide exchange factor 6-like isoform X1 [Oncorhynchus nerka]|uniref:rho guanine nucleotide exchange factor 6-like isoform X1 n=2 Tax=Oncorhynchus nerka TaxID=8023 RepID=UPI0011316E8E|nr:rho guanine nucleotide exchange factor 6-like isoform X1 [Oncorhynchus nerka]
MNPEEQTVTWLISLGVLNSPKKNIADPEEFLKTSLKDGVVLCKLMERLVPGTVPKYCPEPRNEAECIANIKEFLRGCTSLKVEGFEPECLYSGEKFNKVLTTLLGVNFATQDCGTERSCPQSGTPAPSQSTTSHTHTSSRSKSLPRQSKPAEMSENGGGGLVLVKARFQFKQNNEDELSFNKGDLISVSRQEEGGWWEGSLNGKTGWFPSNYVREVKPCDKPVSPKASQLTKNYYTVVVQDILEHEREFVKELQTMLSCYLRPLKASNKLSITDSGSLSGNLEEILTFQQGLVLALDECTKVPESQQRLAACYLNLIGQIRRLYRSYCSSHPSAVCVLTDHSEELGTFMESQGASPPGILTLTTSLSKPFMRLDKYPILLQELERHMEEAHPDYSDILKVTVAFKSLVAQCQDLRKRKNLELQILSEPVRGWEGDGMKSLGHVAYMSLVHMQNGTNEEKEERYLMMFPSVLVLLSASPRMSGFIYQGRLPLTGSTVSRQTEDTENGHYTFEITGSTMDRITVFCSNPQELQEWLDHLHAYSEGASPVGTIIKPVSMVGTPTHLPSFSTPSQANRGPLEPPKTTKPWSLSCLRPAPPLKPSAALGYKERMSSILKDSSKSSGPIKNFFPKRRAERKHSDEEFLLRKSTAALEEDAQILKVIEAYCTGASQHQASTAVKKVCVPQVLLPEEEKIMVEEMKNNGQTSIEEKSLVDAVYALKDEVHELKKENKWMKQCMEEEQKSRKELERVVRKLAKQKNDCAWEDGGH